MLFFHENINYHSILLFSLEIVVFKPNIPSFKDDLRYTIEKLFKLYCHSGTLPGNVLITETRKPRKVVGSVYNRICTYIMNFIVTWSKTN